MLHSKFVFLLNAIGKSQFLELACKFSISLLFTTGRTVRFSNLGVLVVIDCPFLFLSSFLKPQIPGVLSIPSTPSNDSSALKIYFQFLSSHFLSWWEMWKNKDALLISGQSCTLVWMPELKFKSWTNYM